tara:strand:- start:35 stop:667 length:633 start_codon:yes stop_codon:yes gene_type:complete
MSPNILILIILAVVGVSLYAFKNRELQNKMLYIPYDCKHNGRYSTMFTHIFIHADTNHLMFNMFSMYFLGDVLLNYGLINSYGVFVGQAHFLALFILGGLFATLIPYIRNQDNPNYRSLGASGAVSAIIFAAIMWNPGMKLNIMFIPIDIPAVVFGPLYLLYEFYAAKKGNTGIAHDAHIGGAMFGVIYVLIINFGKGTDFLEAVLNIFN